jgi:hypothetical protein
VSRQSLAAIAALALFFSAGSPAAAGDSRDVFIHDPVLDMDAYKVVIPNGWHFQGRLLQGTQCSPIPFPVFRTFSPDGLSEVERLPRFDWFWSDNPYAPQQQAGCLTLKRTVTASEFLKLLSAMLGVEYTGEEPVPAADLARLASQVAERNAASLKRAGPGRAITETKTTAKAGVRYRNGSFEMRGILTGSVQCFTTQLVNFRGPAYTSHSCSASIRYVHAPAAGFAAVWPQLDPAHTGAAAIPAWESAYLMAKSQQAMAASRAMFERDMAARQQEHEQFMATMQRGTDMSMQRAAAIANQNHTIAADWCDYSLDEQTVRDPNTGQVSKVSSTQSFTWIDSSGRTSFQTNDVNANPNGALPGTWTKQTRVHGDGS